MSTPVPSIREVLLTLVSNQAKQGSGGNLQQTGILDAARRQLVPHYGDADTEEAILTQWHELFRTGLLAWGYNLSNPNPPFFHLTAGGKRALANVSRDPSNPAGYLKHLGQRSRVNPIAMSYLTEGLDCYVAGLHKAAAVMVGCAAESLVIVLRDAVVDKFNDRQRPIPKDLQNWMIRPVTTALTKVFEQGIDAKQDRNLRQEFETYWSAFTGQLRIARNEAGHPASVDPVRADTVHASLLIFPELAVLAESLSDWIASRMP